MNGLGGGFRGGSLENLEKCKEKNRCFRKQTGSCLEVNPMETQLLSPGNSLEINEKKLPESLSL